MFLSFTNIFPYCETVVRNAKFANKLLIINDFAALCTKQKPKVRLPSLSCISYSRSAVRTKGLLPLLLDF